MAKDQGEKKLSQEKGKPIMNQTLCVDVVEIQFEVMQEGTIKYGDRVSIDQPQKISKFCSVFEKDVGKYSSQLSRRKPWAWIGFFKKNKKLTTSVTIEQQSDLGVLIVGDLDGSRELTQTESKKFKNLITTYP